MNKSGNTSLARLVSDEKTAKRLSDTLSETLEADETAVAAFEAPDGQWIVESPMGRVVVAFAPANDLGVLDHHVTLASGETFYNPMRVTADGASSEIMFSLRRQPGVSDEDFERDAAAVLADLVALRRKMERG